MIWSTRHNTHHSALEYLVLPAHAALHACKDCASWKGAHTRHEKCRNRNQTRWSNIWMYLRPLRCCHFEVCEEIWWFQIRKLQKILNMMISNSITSRHQGMTVVNLWTPQRLDLWIPQRLNLWTPQRFKFDDFWLFHFAVNGLWLPMPSSRPQTLGITQARQTSYIFKKVDNVFVNSTKFQVVCLWRQKYTKFKDNDRKYEIFTTIWSPQSSAICWFLQYRRRHET